MRRPRLPGRDHQDTELQLMPVETEPVRKTQEPDIYVHKLTNDELVDALREAARRAGHRVGLGYRKCLYDIVRKWRARNTPEFSVAADELYDLIDKLKADSLPQVDE